MFFFLQKRTESDLTLPFLDCAPKEKEKEKGVIGEISWRKKGRKKELAMIAWGRRKEESSKKERKKKKKKFFSENKREQVSNISHGFVPFSEM